jgi:hypothetical protein
MQRVKMRFLAVILSLFTISVAQAQSPTTVGVDVLEKVYEILRTSPKTPVTYPAPDGSILILANLAEGDVNRRLAEESRKQFSEFQPRLVEEFTRFREWSTNNGKRSEIAPYRLEEEMVRLWKERCRGNWLTQLLAFGYSADRQCDWLEPGSGEEVTQPEIDRIEKGLADHTYDPYAQKILSDGILSFDSDFYRTFLAKKPKPLKEGFAWSSENPQGTSLLKALQEWQKKGVASTDHTAVFNPRAIFNSAEVLTTTDFVIPAGGPEEEEVRKKALRLVQEYAVWVLHDSRDFEGAMKQYWSDYREVLGRFTDISEPLPVLFRDTEGRDWIARWLVGFRVNGWVRGFIAVDPQATSVQSDLMWKEDLKPLWKVPATSWNKARSVNDIPELKELIPTSLSFSAGIPIDPSDALQKGFVLVDGISDLAPKTQEERETWINFLNREYEGHLGRPMRSNLGRRTGTSKCISVATSHIADWWILTTGRSVPSYVNGVGGQKEYGINPRLLETIFYYRHQDTGWKGKWVGDFKTAPFAFDRVTGEAVPYSPRGYARILTETGANEWKDPLAPDLLNYSTDENPFAMDRRPLLFQISRDGIFANTRLKQDIRMGNRPDSPFSLEPEFEKPVTEERLRHAIDTWGPLLGQHMMRFKEEKPMKGPLAVGVHGVTIVGYGTQNGRTYFIYRETFGNGRSKYLEDSYLGPEYRMMPMEYFYQAIAFPHWLYLDLKPREGGGDFVFDLTVTANRGRDRLDPDKVDVRLNGSPLGTRLERNSVGAYEITVSRNAVPEGGKVEVRAYKRYFADRKGRNHFGRIATRTGDGWRIDPADHTPAR